MWDSRWNKKGGCNLERPKPSLTVRLGQAWSELQRQEADQMEQPSRPGTVGGLKVMASSSDGLGMTRF